MLHRVWLAFFLMLLATLPARAGITPDPYTWLPGQVISASTQNARFSTLYTLVNGNLDNANINASAAIAMTKLDLTQELPILRSAAARCFSAGNTGDTIYRCTIDSNGKIHFGPGGGSALDTLLKRESSGVLAIRDEADSSYSGLKAGVITSSAACVINHANTGLTINDSDSSNKVTLAPGNESADCTLNIPVLGATDTVMTLGTAQTMTGVKTSTAANVINHANAGLSVNDTASNNKTTIVQNSDEAADRTLNIPALGGNDTIATLATSQTFSGTKTFSTALGIGSGGTNNGSLSVTAGNVPYFDGSKMTAVGSTAGSFVRWANGGSVIEAFAPYYGPGGRLTLSTGVPVTTSDVTAAGTIYYTPYVHNRIWLKRTNFEEHSFVETSLSLTLTSGSVYDVFGFSNAGTLNLETLVWSSTTARATAIVVDSTTGLWVKSGDASRIYLGTIYATASNQTEDSAARRMVFNAYNRVPRKLFARDTTDSWTYATGTWRAARANTTPGVGRTDFVIGGFVADTTVEGSYASLVESAGTIVAYTGIALNSTTSPSVVASANITTASLPLVVTQQFVPALGYSYMQNLEKGHASTPQFDGDAGTTDQFTYQSGWLLNYGLTPHVKTQRKLKGESDENVIALAPRRALRSAC